MHQIILINNLVTLEVLVKFNITIEFDVQTYAQLVISKVDNNNNCVVNVYSNKLVSRTHIEINQFDIKYYYLKFTDNNSSTCKMIKSSKKINKILKII